MTDWDKVSFVMGSQPRLKVFLKLINSKRTPSSLAEDIGIPISHVSKALSELKEKELVECLTPGKRKMKLYQATEEGLELKDEIKEVLEDNEGN